MLPQIAKVHLFSLLYSIPLHEYITMYINMLLLKDICNFQCITNKELVYKIWTDKLHNKNTNNPIEIRLETLF